MKPNALIALFIILPLCGCGHREEVAEGLLTEARSAYEAGDLLRAKNLTDSLRSAYVDVPTVYKQARELASEVREAEKLRTTRYLDSLLAALTYRRDTLLKHMTLIDDKALQPTYVAKTQQFARTFDRCLLRGTVDPAGGFSLTSNFTGERHINHHHVRLKVGETYAETAPCIDLVLNHQFESEDYVWEVVRYPAEDSENIAKFVSDNADQHILVDYAGDKAHVRAWLTPTDKQALRTEWLLALTLREITCAQALRKQQVGGRKGRDRG